MDPAGNYLLFNATTKEQVGPHLVLKTWNAKNNISVIVSWHFLAVLCRFPQDTIPAHVAKEIVLDLRTLDEQPRMNLATFVTTYMEKDAEEVFQQTWNVNGADSVQYPSCKAMEAR